MAYSKQISTISELGENVHQIRAFNLHRELDQKNPIQPTTFFGNPNPIISLCISGEEVILERGPEFDEGDLQCWTYTTDIQAALLIVSEDRANLQKQIRRRFEFKGLTLRVYVLPIEPSPAQILNSPDLADVKHIRGKCELMRVSCDAEIIEGWGPAKVNAAIEGGPPIRSILLNDTELLLTRYVDTLFRAEWGAHYEGNGVLTIKFGTTSRYPRKKASLVYNFTHNLILSSYYRHYDL